MEGLTLTLGDLIVIITVLISFAGCLCSFWLLRDKDLKRINERIEKRVHTDDCITIRKQDKQHADMTREQDEKMSKVLNSTLVGSLSELKTNFSDFKQHSYNKMEEISKNVSDISESVTEKMLKESQSNQKFQVKLIQALSKAMNGNVEKVLDSD